MKLLLCLLSAIFHLWYCGQVKATAVISPPETVPACIGDQLVLLCNVTGNVLKWGINLFLSTAGDESYSRILSTFSETTYLQINNTQFTFSRVSPSGSSPIKSSLLISPVSSYLNGTVVNCIDRDTGKSSSTIINVITDTDSQINITLLPERFENDDVVITLEWIHRTYYLYNISVAPLLELPYSDTTRITFNISYNIYYNVSITVLPPCELSSMVTFITLYYVSCGDPTNLTDSSSKKISITHYRKPALEGTRIYFDCPTGLVLTGPNSSTCMGNGEWEPLPREAECKAMQMDVTEGSGSLINQPVQIIIISIAVCILCSMLFFAVGFLCHHYCPNCKQSVVDESISPTIIGKQESTENHEMQQKIPAPIELSSNVAYVSVQL